MAEERIVSIGFLTERDLNRLGMNFTNHIPVPDDDIFSDLLAQLDTVEAVSLGNGIAIMPNQGGKPA